MLQNMHIHLLTPQVVDLFLYTELNIHHSDHMCNLLHAEYTFET